jgi:NAD(P)-dependent dehydrogenase (short-subunit alcohol dehydrogenase family)
MSPSAQAVVVGATGETGSAIVARLRNAEVPVVAVARDLDRLEQMSAADDGITVCRADIGDDSSGAAIAAAVSGRVRMVVQSAAVPPAGPLATRTDSLIGPGSSRSAACSAPNRRRKHAMPVSPTLLWPTSSASSPMSTGPGG